RRAVRLERPDLHLTKPLAAELRLTGERLLRDEGVGADAPRVDLVVHQVRELQHVDRAHRYRRRELLARPAVPELNLRARREPGPGHMLLDSGVEALEPLRLLQRGGRGECLLEGGVLT